MMTRQWSTPVGLLGGLVLLAGAGPGGADVERCLARVLDYHGHLGPWAVIGYRVGQRALAETGLRRATKDLVVVHRCPEAVQYTCMLDGLHAATGASLGKLTLKHEAAPADRMCTIVTDRAHGRVLTFTVRPELVASILDLPPAGQVAEARRVAALPDDAIFRVRVEPAPAR